jgi:hypothetical protein
MNSERLLQSSSVSREIQEAKTKKKHIILFIVMEHAVCKIKCKIKDERSCIKFTFIATNKQYIYMEFY